MKRLCLVVIGFLFCTHALFAVEPTIYDVGLAKVDITPDYSIRLNGFGNRREESEGVSQQVFARAMAISHGDNPPLVLIAIDNLGVRTSHVDEVARRLKKSHKLPRENLALTFSHSHCAPKVNGASDNIFSSPIPAEHQRHIDRYTKEIVDLITKAAQQAMDARAPARLSWSIGQVTFAKNRRPGGGPSDHDLPTLFVQNVDDDTIRGIYVSYACHCVTLRFNKISGDWAGYAAEILEREHSDAIALVSIGAGSDQNPTEVSPEKTEVAQRQGAEIATEVKRLSRLQSRPIAGETSATLTSIPLPLNQIPTREQLADVAKNGLRATDRYNASTQLAKIRRGEKLLTEIDYPIQTWSFGDSLCMTFLAGEVCVDYSLRLKKELDRNRFWLNAYSNDFCSYIPSERLVKEGGYGGGSETPYFALPTTLASGLEQKIINEVHRQVPREFHVPVGVRGIAPKSPQESLECMQTLKSFDVKLVASEPQIQDPIAIDFGVDGCVWVAEMCDYGRGVYEQFKPTGRIRCLHDRDRDGRFETTTTYLDGLRFPTDVKVWRDGLLICDAPDILFARDTDDDGVADETKQLFSGFEVRNAQARVNSLRWGLDNWIYGSCGLFGGQVLSHKTGETIDLRSRDFRLNPDTGEIEAVAGRTQQGRDRNDWGDWFGCSNGSLLRHYNTDEQYLGRNPFVAVAAPPSLTGSADAFRLLPPDNIVRFELTGAHGKPTAACGLGILRDDRWGDGYGGSAFTCEPVNQLVHRMQLTPRSLGYVAARSSAEQETEFLRSTDQWFRPVQARTGPDGALWVVDMYRFVIEHPRWIPQTTLAELDVFAGQRRGRIYRVVPNRLSKKQADVLSTQSNKQLVTHLQSPNGITRDLAHQSLVWRAAADVDDELRSLVSRAQRPVAKVHSLYVLSALEKLREPDVRSALSDEHDEVVRHALRLSEHFIDDSSALRKQVASLATHDNARVRRQVAWTLGETTEMDAVDAFVRLASKQETNAHVRSAVLTSLRKENVRTTFDDYLELPRSSQSMAIVRELARSTIRLGGPQEIDGVLTTLLKRDGDDVDKTTLAMVLDAADASAGKTPFVLPATVRQEVRKIHASALQSLDKSSLTLLGRRRGAVTRALLTTESGTVMSTEDVIAAISPLIDAKHPVTTQTSAISAVAATGHESVGDVLLDRLPRVSGQARTSLLDALLSRDTWTLLLLDRVSKDKLRVGVLDVTRRSNLKSHPNERVRTTATKILNDGGSSTRSAVVRQYQTSFKKEGNVARGRQIFRKECAACHRLEEHGFVVGPDLQALTNRDPKWLLATIFDPNREVDSRYLAWSAVTDEGRIFSGMMVEETASSVKLREAGGKEHIILRGDLEQLRSTQVSVMPEGLEKEIQPADASDLIAYLTEVIGASKQPTAKDALPRRAPEIAPFLLDDTQTVERRQAAIDARPGMGPAIIGLLTANLDPNDEAQRNRTIPWVWRVALAVGKRNDGGEIRDVLDTSLPPEGDVLTEWQAVVIGGGIINGLTQVDQWPRRRIDAILDGAPSIKKRWPAAIESAAKMADDKRVKLGTRYDALRMIALGDKDEAITHLKRYLGEGTERQLQMGAVSGLADIESDDVIQPLIKSLPHLDKRNRELAIEGLQRTPKRKVALLRIQAAARTPKD